MSEEFNPMPDAPVEKKDSKKTIIIIAVVAIVLLCCCCLVVVGYTQGDKLLNLLNF